jgi:hypothetical protein
MKGYIVVVEVYLQGRLVDSYDFEESKGEVDSDGLRAFKQQAMDWSMGLLKDESNPAASDVVATVAGIYPVE